MTPFASVALFQRNGEIVYRPPRKEHPTDKVQARKSAVRFWRGSIAETDKLVIIILVREEGGRLEISERAVNGNVRSPWMEYKSEIAAGLKNDPIAACIAELGIATDTAPPTVPDVLVINGFTYRRDI